LFAGKEERGLNRKRPLWSLRIEPAALTPAAGEWGVRSSEFVNRPGYNPTVAAAGGPGRLYTQSRVLVFVLIGKLFLPLIQPLGIASLLWLAAGVAYGLGRRRGGLLFLLSGICLVLVLSSPLVGSRLLRTLEDDFAILAPQALPTADAIVVLGGMTAPLIAPRVDVDVTGSFDRLLHGLRLFRAGKAPHIVLSGGVMAKLVGSTVSEARRLRQLALEYGVPPAALLLEERSRTTRENAVYTQELLQQQGLKRILLVTSAAHMRRAVGVFRAVGIDVVPAPTDVLVVPKPAHLFSIWPSADGLDYSTRATKEYVGWWVYRLRGWVH
jgi:uncharacterized SAM-binding protein YcdF (DUF218 family)